MLEENHVVRDFEKDNKFALIFVTEFYDKPNMDLKDIPFVKNDLKMCKVICKSMGIRKRNIKLYIDKNRDEINKMIPEMKLLIKKITNENKQKMFIYVYFAGHGISDSF